MPEHPQRSEIKVSIGQGVAFNKPNKIRLDGLYNNFIRNSEAKHSASIKELREYVDQHISTINKLSKLPDLTTTQKAELKQLNSGIDSKKKQLFAFCWSGIFDTSSGAPKSTGLLQHSGRLQIDIDWKDRPRVESEQLRDKLGSDPHIEVTFLSPTARGVKCGLLVPVCADDQEHKRTYFAAERYFRETYDIKIDPSCKDVRRICFVSHDPQLVSNPSAIPLDIEKWLPEVAGDTVVFDPDKASYSVNPVKYQQSAPEYQEPTDDEWADIFKHIKGYDDRDTWIKVGHACKEHFGPAGYDHWAEWSSQSSKWQNAEESANRRIFDGFTPTSTKGIATLIYLAQEGGWSPTKNNQSTDTQQQSTVAVIDPAQRGAGTPNNTSGDAIQGNFHTVLDKNGNAVLVPNLHNVHQFFTVNKLPVWYDSFTRQTLTTLNQQNGDVVEWSDALTIRLTKNFQSKDGMRRISRNIIDEAIQLYSKENTCNRLTEWLSSLQWDGTPRLDHWLTQYCGVDDSIYTREAGRCWLLGAVTRAFQPGTQFDHCLIFEGRQGCGKSSAIRILSNGWYTEIDSFTGKDSAEVLQGVWLVELSELDGMRKSEVESVKRFITTITDRYRPAYGRHVVSMPRSCVFAGTTNEESYLRDATGNRRFWPVRCSDIDLEQLRVDRDVLIAEAVHRYQQSESLLMSAEARTLAVEAQEERFQIDSWEALTSQYLEGKTVTTIPNVLGLGLELENKALWNKGTEMRVGNILRRLGWKPQKVREGKKTVNKYVKCT